MEVFVYHVAHIEEPNFYIFYFNLSPPFFSATLCLEYLKIGMVYFLNFISADLYNLDTVMTLMQLET